MEGGCYFLCKRILLESRDIDLLIILDTDTINCFIIVYFKLYGTDIS